MKAHGTDNMSAILINFQTNKKTLKKMNDEISSLLQKYLIVRKDNTNKKIQKQKGND